MKKSNITSLAALATMATFAAPDGNTGGLGFTGHLTPVHKSGQPGAIDIDSYTGQVATPADQRPEWADGLALANLAERHKFYTDRLGPQYADEHKAPELLAYEDLEWLGVDMETGSEVTYPADTEHRMEVMATVLGIERDADTADIAGATTAVEMASDNRRTEAEMADFRQEQEAGFKEATGE